MDQDSVHLNPYSPPAALLAEDGHVSTRPVPNWLAFLAAAFVASLVIRPGILVDPLRESVLGEPGVETAGRGLILMADSLPWILAPILALLSDVVPLGKVRRRSWLLLAAGAAFLLWPVLAGIGGQRGLLLAVQLALVLAVVLFWVAQWGLAAEIGRGHAATGAVGGTYVVALHLTLLLVVLLGPVFETLELIWFAVLACAVLVGFGIYAARTLSKPVLPSPTPVPAAFSWSSFLIAALLLLLLGIGSSGGKSYLQASRVETSQNLLAGPDWTSHLIVGLGGLAYVWLCRRVALRWLLLAAFGGTAAATALIFADGALPVPWIVEGRWSLLGLASLPLLDLSLRVVRPGREAFGFAILQGCSLLGIGLSSVILMPLAQFAPAAMMPALFAAFLPALALVFLLPPELGRARDGEAMG
jgi:hypothetical protein